MSELPVACGIITANVFFGGDEAGWDAAGGDSFNNNAAIVSLRQLPIRLDEDSRVALRKISTQLRENLEPREMTAGLLEWKILTDDCVKYLFEEIHRPNRVEYVITAISRRCRDLCPFRAALLSADSPYSYLASDLDAAHPAARLSQGSGDPSGALVPHLPLPTPERHLKTVLQRGGVPQLPAVLVTREQWLAEIRKHLHELSKELSGFVVLHGMHGIGKSVLAAHALEDAELVGDDGRFDHVVWIRIGRLAQETGARAIRGWDSGVLVSILNAIAEQIYCMHQSRHQPPNLPLVDVAARRIQLALQEFFPRCLLVLDDVPSPLLARSLDFGVRTLITTPDARVAKVVGGPTWTQVISGFRESESLEYLGRVMSQSVDELPKEAKQIHTIAEGHAHVISLVGSVVQKRPTRWTYCRDKLLTVSNLSSYEYGSFHEIAKISLGELPSSMVERLKDLALFSLGIKIPSAVLSVLWDVDVENVEDSMEKLTQFHLVETDSTTETESYWLQTLFHLHLKREHDPSQHKALHARLLNAYEKRYTVYHSFPNDGYIYYYLGRHLRRAGRDGDFSKVFLDLAFLGRQVAYCGPTQTLSDFSRYGQFIERPKPFRKIQYQKFLCANAGALAHKDTDIVQSAILEPYLESVRNDGINFARQNVHAFYVTAVNNPWHLGNNPCQLTYRPHMGKILSLTYLPDHFAVITCSNDGLIMISSLKSTEILRTYTGHKDSRELLHCMVVTEEKIIASLGPRLIKHNYSPQDMKHHFPSQSSRDERDISWDAISLRDGSSTDSPPISPVAVAPDSALYLVTCLSVTPSGGHLACGCDDHAIRVYDLSDGTPSGTLSCAHQVASAARHRSPRRRHRQLSSPSLAWTSSTEGSSDMVDGSMGSGRGSSALDSTDTRSSLSLSSKGGHTGVVTRVRFSPGEQYLLSCSSDHTARIWDLTTLTSVCSLNHEAPVLGGAFLTCGHYVGKVLTFTSTTIWIWPPDKSVNSWHNVVKLTTNDLTRKLLPDKTEFCSVAVTPIDNIVAAGMNNNEIWLIDLKAQQRLTQLPGHSDVVRNFGFSPDGSTMVSGGDDGAIMQWDVAMALKRRPPTHLLKRVFAAYMSTSETSMRWVLGQEKDHKLLLLDATSRLLWQYDFGQQFDGKTRTVAERTIAVCEASPCGKWAVFGTLAGRIYRLHIGPLLNPPENKNTEAEEDHLCELLDGQPLPQPSPSSVTFHAHAALVAVAASKGIRVWDCTENKIDQQLEGHSEVPGVCSVSSCANWAATISATEIKVWNLSQGQPAYGGANKLTLPSHPTCLAFSPHGDHLAIADQCGDISVWLVASGRRLFKRRPAKGDLVSGLAWAPDQACLVTLAGSTLQWFSLAGSSRELSSLQRVTLGASVGNGRLYVNKDFDHFVTIDINGHLYVFEQLK